MIFTSDFASVLWTLLFRILAVLTAYITFRAGLGFIKDRKNAAAAKAMDCGDIYMQTDSLPFGLEKIQEAFQADKLKLFPDLVIKRFTDAGVPTFKYKLLGTTGLLTCEPKNIQAVLATQFNDFSLGELRRNNFLPLLGNGIFVQDGKGWEHSRALLRPQFAREQVSDLTVLERHVQNLMRALPVNDGGLTDTTDLQTLFFRLTLDSATEFLFGESVDSQVVNLPDYALETKGDPTRDEKVFAEAFDKGQAALATRARLSDFYWLAEPQNFRKNCKSVHAFVDYFVKIALSKELKEKEIEKGNIDEKHAKDRYVFLDALAQETRDPIELRSQALNILLAGRDTTASLLGWLFYILARNPDDYTRLRATVLEDFGTYERPHSITFSSLKSNTFLQHCMNEALRLYPVVPVNSRRAVRNTTLPVGGGPNGKDKVFVAKGQQVDYSVHALHRRKDLWGQDADEWKPDRWIGRRPGWEYLPFNGGPRICLGQQLALTEASYTTVRLLQRFDTIENWETDPVVRHNLTLTSCPGNGVKVKLHTDSV